MPRILDSAFQAALDQGVISPAILVQLTFNSGVQHIWTGIGPLVYDAQTYLGVGALGGVGTITEGSEVRADGTSVSLSGVDPALYAESLTDIKLGAPAKIWLALLSQGALLGAPYLLFSGLVDKPTTSPGPESMTISLALESRMTNLQRASQRRYTAADQHIRYPDDIGFNWVEILSDIALRWGA
jgi:hypothetical protein